MWGKSALTHIWRIHYLTLAGWECQNHSAVMWAGTLWFPMCGSNSLAVRSADFTSLHGLYLFYLIRIQSVERDRLEQRPDTVLYLPLHGNWWMRYMTRPADRPRIDVPYLFTGNHRHPDGWAIFMATVKISGLGFSSQEKGRVVWLTRVTGSCCVAVTVTVTEMTQFTPTWRHNGMHLD